MKNLMFAAMFVLSSFNPTAEASKVDADYLCEQPGGGVAVKLPTATSKGRMWQTDEGEIDGLEFQVTKMSVFKCRGCFSFEANLKGQLKVRGTATNSVLNYEGYDADNQTWLSIAKGVKCKFVKAPKI